MKGSTVIWEKSTTPVDLYLENTYNGTNTVSVKRTLSGSPNSGAYVKHLQYSKDGLNWTTITLSSTAYTISLAKNEKVYFRGNEGVFNYWTSGGSQKAITTISASQNHTVGGNINTLLDYTNPNGVTLPQGAFNSMFQSDTKLTSVADLTLPSSLDGSLPTYAYLYMFKGCSSLISAPQSIPAKVQGQDACNGMFANCTSLTAAPALPATTLAASCYWSMFEGCTSLTTAPALPATTVTSSCYRSMFQGCTSLTTSPALPANTLVLNCYRSMFEGCSLLDNITVYANDNSATDCTQNWLNNVAATGTFYNLGSATYTINSASGIPVGWTEVKQEIDYFYVENTNNGDNTLRVTVNPDTHNIGNHAVYLEYSKDKISWTRIHLPSTPLTEIPMTVGQKVYFRNDNGYFNYLTTTTDSYTFLTFFNCTNSHNVGGEISTLLNYKNSSVPCSKWCFYHLFSNNQTLVNATNLKIPQNIDEYCCYGMFYGCTGLTTAPALPATTLARECYRQMFFGCTSLTTAPALPATTLVRGCYENMFGGCTSLTVAPELPAKNLIMYCYYYMFYGCTSLNSVTIYADNAEEGHYYLDNWLSGVAATGTFYNNGTATYTIDSPSGIPTGWTEVKPSTGPDYFYLENVDSQSGNVTFKFNGTPSSSTIQQIEWSKDKTNWTPVTLVADTTTNVPVSVGEKVYFRNDSGKLSSASNLYFTFGGDVLHDAGGDVNTLLDYKTDTTTLSIDYIFSHLFYGDANLRNAGNLTLGYTTLSNYCYSSMFQSCTSLTTAPSLPATTMKISCYRYMFMSCFSLTTAPSLPATTLATNCYNDMFRICTSLTTAPSLPATTLAQNCYDGMFNSCTSLTVAPSLPATTLAQSCYSNMFNSCTSLTTAPTLPTTTLASFCYSNMFIGCTSLNSVTTYANNISAIYCLNNWLKNVAATGTFHNLGSATYPTGASGIPTGWTEVKS